MAASPIQYHSRSSLDIGKYNDCVRNDRNGRIYAFSFYLDAMAENWGALVMGNYQAVMPLPWKKKWGISYIYQPPFTAQLGIFGEGFEAGDFFEEIPSRFKLIDLPLHNQLAGIQSSFLAAQRTNYILDLNTTYENLYSAYRENIKRNIRKSNSSGCYAKKDIEITHVLDIAREQEKGRTSEEAFDRFKKLYDHLSKEGNAIAYGIFSPSNQLLASSVFCFSHSRAYYILVGNHPNGRTLGASHALIDAFIKDYAGRDLLLDFEGSDIRNLAFFYSSYGAVEEKYNHIRWNRLPWWLKWLKT